MRLRDREPSRILAAPFTRRHWQALFRILTTFTTPASALVRYLTNGGRYPWQTTLRTPLGPVRVTLADRHDLLTVNEVFCRRDYGSAPFERVVDIGANVGFATLFFLTRTAGARVVAFEPDPENVRRLRENLDAFRRRYTLVEAAVTADRKGEVMFSPAGRYGHLGNGGDAIAVAAVPIAEALRAASEELGPIQLLKIDTEGTEAELVAAIPPDVEVEEIRFEDDRGRVHMVRGKTADARTGSRG